MHYTVTFYATRGEALARTLRESPDAIVQEVEKNFRRQKPADDQEWQRLRELVVRLCRGDLPPECEPAYFYALGWLANTAAERVQICGFEGFRHLRFLEELAIWPELQRYSCPFVLPRCADDHFAAGYMPVEGIKVFTEETFAHLPPSADRDVINLRDDFHYTLTTLVDDHLDLLAILTEA